MSSTAIPQLASEDLFDALDLKDVAEEEKASLLVQMMEIIQGRVFDRVFDALDATQRDRLLEMLDADQIDEVEGFLTTNIPNYYALFEEEAKKLRHQLIVKMAA